MRQRELQLPLFVSTSARLKPIAKQTCPMYASSMACHYCISKPISIGIQIFLHTLQTFPNLYELIEHINITHYKYKSVKAIIIHWNQIMFLSHIVLFYFALTYTRSIELS